MPQTAKQYEAAIVREMTNLLKGRTIKRVRAMTNAESEANFWCSRAIVIELDDGTILFPSRDDEGNDAGALFGTLPDGSNIAAGVFR